MSMPPYPRATRVAVSVVATPGDPAPAPSPPRGLWPDRYSVVFAIAISMLTLCAVSLALVAPGLSRSHLDPSSAGLIKMYDADLHNDGNWSPSSGTCAFQPDGLDVVGANATGECTFRPSVNTDFTSRGFLLEIQLAPAASVPRNQVALVTIGDANIMLNQNGIYTLCTSASCAGGATVAWHGDAYVGNAIAVLYDVDTESLTLYVNGQEVASGPATLIQAAIALGAATNGEALYTHMTLYAGSGSPV